MSSGFLCGGFNANKIVDNCQETDAKVPAIKYAKNVQNIGKPARGVEPRTFSLRMKCSATELYGL